ncbi:MAG: magnesium and cobalt transport protein CorA, partial [Nostocales cyanobacterium]
INSLIRDSSEIISDEVRIYLRDCYDHSIQVIDMVETYRELSSGLMDVYLSAVSNKMNEIMKILTVVSSIFIPLTFVAGIYGMNFNPDKSPYNMPELNSYWGYPICLGFMALIAGSLLFIFWKKGWLSHSISLKE